jgi:hypothetical protein
VGGSGARREPIAHRRHQEQLTLETNAFAERWARTVREVCLNWCLLLGERHLRQVLHEYVGHFN